MSSTVDLSAPLALYSIPAAWLTVFYPMKAKHNLITNHGGYDNVQPRSNVHRLEGKVSPEIAARAERMEGAHLNGNEILPLWIGAVLASNFAGLANRTVNYFSIAFVASRMAYNYVYINQATQAQSRVRTVVWMVSVALPMTLFVKAANKLRLGLFY